MSEIRRIENLIFGRRRQRKDEQFGILLIDLAFVVIFLVIFWVTDDIAIAYMSLLTGLGYLYGRLRMLKKAEKIYVYKIQYDYAIDDSELFMIEDAHADYAEDSTEIIKDSISQVAEYIETKRKKIKSSADNIDLFTEPPCRYKLGKSKYWFCHSLNDQEIKELLDTIKKISCNRYSS